jgi:hypothetical protein
MDWLSLRPPSEPNRHSGITAAKASRRVGKAGHRADMRNSLAARAPEPRAACFFSVLAMIAVVVSDLGKLAQVRTLGLSV